MYVCVCMYKLNYFNFSCTSDEKDLNLGFRAFSIQLFQLRLSPKQSGKVEYERERLLGIAIISYSTFPLCSGDNLN
jgi:hypothetical protein